MFCPNCGAESENSAKFCVHCGWPLQEPSTCCYNCGCKVERGDAFCPECGARLEVEENPEQWQQLQQQLPPRSRKKGILFVCLAVAGATAGAGGAFLYLNHKPVIDLKSCYTITLTGHDKDATVSVDIDEEKLGEKCQNLTLNKKKAKAAIRKQADSSSSLESSDVDENYQEMFEEAGKNTAEIVHYNLEQDMQIKPEKKLSNGDTIDISYDEARMEILEAAYGCEFTSLTEYTVEGLGKTSESEKNISNSKKKETNNSKKESKEEKSDREEKAEVTPTPTPSPIPQPTATPIPEPTATPVPVRTNTALRPDFYKDGVVTGTSEDYICPDSIFRQLTAEELACYSNKGLCFIRNEMFARLGRQFDTPELAEYFNSMPWYNGTVSSGSFEEANYDGVTIDGRVVSTAAISYNTDLLVSLEEPMGLYIPFS